MSCDTAVLYFFLTNLSQPELNSTKSYLELILAGLSLFIITFKLHNLNLMILASTQPTVLATNIEYKYNITISSSCSENHDQD